MRNKKTPGRQTKGFQDSTKADQKVKLLFYDIEVSPSLGYVWGKWEQNVLEFDKKWYILSVAYKWGDGETRVVGLPDFPRYKKDPEDDSQLVKFLWELFDKADATIAHNNKRFDYKKSNTRFIQYGLHPPSPYKVIDTLPVAKKHFNFLSNTLDDLGHDLGVGRKIETPYSVWRGCIHGDMRSWKRMKSYNKNDVELLYKVYMKLLPWMGGLHNFTNCPKCGANSLQRRGHRHTIGRRYQRYQCLACGGWSSERTGEKTNKLLMSL